MDAARVQVFTNHMFDRPGSMGNPLFAAGGGVSGTGDAAFLAELQARAEAESKQLESDVKAVRKSRRFSQVHSVNTSLVSRVALVFARRHSFNGISLQCLVKAGNDTVTSDKASQHHLDPCCYSLR